MTLRRTTSLIALLSFILLLISSIILYIAPQGKIAYWANWKSIGLDKEQWGALHTNLGFLFLVAGIIHIILNWKPIMVYLKNKSKEIKVFTADFNIALIITLFITLFTFFELQPVAGIQHFSNNLKDAAAETYGEPPYGHAEASTLAVFCKRTGIELEIAVEKLEAAEFSSVSPAITLGELASINGTTPQQLYSLIKPAAEKMK